MSSPSKPTPPFSSITLPQHPECPIAYNLSTIHGGSQSRTTTPILIVFVNGLMLPQASWAGVIGLLSSALSSSTASNTPVSVLTYDRYGQGLSRLSPSPSDANSSWKPEPHSFVSATDELHALLDEILPQHFSPPTSTDPSSISQQATKIIFVSHSIGVPLIRLFDQRHPGYGSAHLFLDSNIANIDFASIFPEIAKSDDQTTTTTTKDLDLPEDSTLDDLRRARELYKRMFSPSTPNPEGIDRSDVPLLLPAGDGPILSSPSSSSRPPNTTTIRGEPDSDKDRNTPPYLTVIGHDPAAFAEESFKLSSTPCGLTLKYVQPVWERYNEELSRIGTYSSSSSSLGDDEEGKGRENVVIAEGSGHFVQRDNPACVVREIVRLIGRVG